MPPGRQACVSSRHLSAHNATAKNDAPPGVAITLRWQLIRHGCCVMEKLCLAPRISLLITAFIAKKSLATQLLLKNWGNSSHVCDDE